MYKVTVDWRYENSDKEHSAQKEFANKVEAWSYAMHLYQAVPTATDVSIISLNIWQDDAQDPCWSVCIKRYV